MVAGKLDLQKRQHRERAQPLKRQRLGLLEKHADYVKRARDFHSKEDRIKRLREKAAGRNKDEFYFGMIKARTSKGVHMQSRGNESLSDDLVKVLKTQDAGYIRTHRAIEERRVFRLQQQLNTLIETGVVAPAAEVDDWDAFDEPAPSSSSAPTRSHILFSSDLDTVRTADPTTLLSKRPRVASTESSSAKRTRKGKAKADPVDPVFLAAEEAARVALAATHRTTLETELSARRERLSNLTRALRELEMQRLLMGNGAKKSLEANKGKPKKEGEGTVDEWQTQAAGGKVVPEAREEGISTGARVWKWKAERKR